METFERLEVLDRWIVLTVNSWNHPFLDQFFWLIASKFFWIPFYFLLLFIAWKKLPSKQLTYFVILSCLSVAIADLTSVYAFKEVIMRYRPSHNAFLTNQLHFYQLENGDFYKGGMYGFVSSHAANFSALTTFVGLALRKYYPKLIFIMYFFVVLICFSRLYQGVHYLSDLIVGAMLGAAIATLFYQVAFKKLTRD